MPLAVLAQPKETKKRDTVVEQKILPLLRESPVASLPNLADKPKSDEFGRYMLPNEIVQHANGIYGLRNPVVNIWQTSPLLFGLYGENFLRVLRPDAELISETNCRKTAMDFATKAFPWFPAEGPWPPIDTPELNSNGCYLYRWQRYRPDELPDTRVEITVRALDARVVGASSSKFTGEWKHKIKPSQAKQIAINHVRQWKTHRDIQVTAWHPNGGGGERFYSMSLSGIHIATGKKAYYPIGIGAENGSVIPSVHGWMFTGMSQNVYPRAEYPVWTAQGLVFSSNQLLADMPTWITSGKQLFLRAPNGSLSYLTSDLTSPPIGGLHGTSGSNWIVLDRSGGTHALNLATGEQVPIVVQNSYRETTAVHPQGAFASLRGNPGAEGPDIDLWIKPLTAQNVTVPGRKLRLEKAYEEASAFSPDGSWLYIVTGSYTKKGFQYRLERISTKEAAQKAELGRPATPQFLGALPLQTIRRLSVFPDGKRLLLDMDKGIHYFDLSTRQFKAIPKFTNLRDPEFKAHPIQSIKHAWAGPGNNEVTFSGYVSQGNRHETRIYSCTLTGTNLRVWTPSKTPQANAYKFPDSALTAYDTTRKMVTAELENFRDDSD